MIKKAESPCSVAAIVKTVQADADISKECDIDPGNCKGSSRGICLRGRLEPSRYA